MKRVIKVPKVNKELLVLMAYKASKVLKENRVQ